MELILVGAQGKGVVQGSDALFARDYNEALVHQVVTAYLANARSGNRAQKGRSEVSKSTRKPWKQKGTGRARAGMASSPLWRGGGKIFPNSPEENFSHKLNRKMYRAGLATILSQLVRQGRLMVVETFELESPKTKLFAERLQSFGVEQHVLLITDNLDENLYLSSRNLPNVLVLEPAQADPVSLVRYRNVVLTRDALKKFEEMLG
ncbi:50S ribosomal protein L4 [Parachitinimonas caeni]|uniref:Large ribosomal subunit protein uL4 n=1 Tax=Parachitinimonas caeni TaxID=3031301 RepID=A0ABT7E4J8_9NEIS|nr:50S ribosomal protein L4 [Parachitinimonas caeni]MDK2126355.1 50S ribosomal protein L4 [Parachitinimonas caeni]